MRGEKPLDRFRRDFPCGYIDDISCPSAEKHLTISKFRQVARAINATGKSRSGIRPIRFPNIVAAHFKTAFTIRHKRDAVHRRTHACGIRTRRNAGIVSNAAALARAIKVMDFQAVPGEHIPFKREWQWRARRDRETHIRCDRASFVPNTPQRRDGGERHRSGRFNGAAHNLWKWRSAENQRNSMQQQRRDQIGKPVRVRQ
jgi:hypothetical protein